MSGLVCILLLMVFGHSLANLSANNRAKREFVDSNALYYPEDEYDDAPKKIELKTYTNMMADPPEPDNRPVAKFAQKLNDFEARLTNAVLEANPNKNVIYSPISLSILLMMIMIGARGNTYVEISRQTGWQFNRETVKGFYDLIRILQDVHGPKLSLANSVFVSRELEYTQSYHKKIKMILGGELKKIPFNDVERSANEINTWASKNTENHISNLVTAEDLFDIDMLIANAVFFRGSWSDAFDETKTKHNVPFHVSKDKTVPVTMMTVDSSFNYGFIEEFSTLYVELPFKHKRQDRDQYTMFAFTPTGNGTLKNLEKNLDIIDYRRLSTIEFGLVLHFPKFNLKSTIDVQPIFEKMGMSQMFSRSADFRGLSSAQNIFVNRIVHKATLKVDEKGSEASAVSYGGFMSRSLPGEITFNRPFVCAIVSKKLGLPVFVARVVDPSESSE